MSEVKRWYVDEWSDCREVNDGPFVKYADHAEQLKACEEERDEWERHLHIERREHQKAIEERDKERAEVEKHEQWHREHEYHVLVPLEKHDYYESLEQSNERLKAAVVDSNGILESVKGDMREMCEAQLRDNQAALKETP